VEFVEKLLEAAAERGAFDAGERSGSELCRGDASEGGWIRRELERAKRDDRREDVIKAVERSLGQVWVLASESAVRDRVTELNGVLAEAGCHESLDLDETVLVWRRMVRIRSSRIRKPV
jgi:hypothetical protein